jgi:hypothetical protein
LRFIQAIGLGEWGGASLMAVEHAPPADVACLAAWCRSGSRSGR